MSRVLLAIGLAAVLGGCATREPETIENGNFIWVTVACDLQANGSPSATTNCEVVAVTPDTSEARRRAEAFVQGLPGYRPDRVERRGDAERIQYRVKLPATEPVPSEKRDGSTRPG